MDFVLEDKERRRKAAIYTGITALILFFCMWFFRAWVEFTPELPDQGAIISFGWEDEGSGETESEKPVENAPQQEDSQTQQTPTNTAQENLEEVVTDDNSEIEVNQNEETTTETTENIAEEQTEDVVEEKNSDKLNNALNDAWNTPAEGQGVGSETGNQGDPSGSKNTKGVINKDGFGVSGDGRGRFEGGIKIADKPTKEGDVAIDVIVDRNGKFVRASINMSATTKMDYPSTSTELINLAMKSIKQTARFNRDLSAPGEQKLTIYFRFRLE